MASVVRKASAPDTNRPKSAERQTSLLSLPLSTLTKQGGPRCTCHPRPFTTQVGCRPDLWHQIRLVIVMHDVLPPRICSKNKAWVGLPILVSPEDVRVMIILRTALFVIFSLTSLSCWAQAQDVPAQAVAALQQMRSHLRDAKDLEFTTQFHVVDKVLGKNVKGSVEYKIRKPNLLRITAKLPTGTVVLISDGKTLTIHEPNRKRYEEMLAKDTVVGTIYLAAGNLGEQARLVDFFWTVDYLAVGGGSGEVGTLKPQTIGSKVCDGFTVQRAQEAWSVWLVRSSDRLPCYVISKSTGGSAFVTQTNALRWNPSPNFPEGTFRFVPPASHRQRD